MNIWNESGGNKTVQTRQYFSRCENYAALYSSLRRFVSSNKPNIGWGMKKNRRRGMISADETFSFLRDRIIDCRTPKSSGDYLTCPRDLRWHHCQGEWMTQAEPTRRSKRCAGRNFVSGNGRCLRVDNVIVLWRWLIAEQYCGKSITWLILYR